MKKIYEDKGDHTIESMTIVCGGCQDTAEGRGIWFKSPRRLMVTTVHGKWDFDQKGRTWLCDRCSDARKRKG